ncbi:MAG: ATP-binding domain-containing protein, partial [Prevotellaceae bacterium]|jgi:DNA helicase-2/ATP-dependent DNA helicase PcrA|nr:ATP-binding domain-containing protein [Prevotellaceae bacterium]
VPYSEFAVLYRTNAQSRTLEEAFRKNNIPYRVYGGLSFYQRAEVKDMLAYLRLIVNPHDDEAFKRAVQAPARGIGDTSLEHLQAAADRLGKSLYETMQSLAPDDIGIRTNIAGKLQSFCTMIAELSSLQPTLNAHELASKTASRSGYITELKNEGTMEANVRLENVDELLNSILEFCNNPENTVPGNENQPVTIREYLENIALLTDMDTEKKEDHNKVRLMTIHSAKGLEFSYVYIAGMEERLFPSEYSQGEEDIEEERRLFYVAITRAKSKATVSFAATRYRYGKINACAPSRFLQEIAPTYLERPILTSGNEPQNTSEYNHRFAPSFEHNPVGNAGTTAAKPFPQTVRRNFAPDRPDSLSKGMTIEHERFGIGVIVSIEGVMPHTKAIVDFENAGRRTLLLQYAKVRIIKN